MTKETVISGYMFFECSNCHHTVDWVNASSESEAWNIYIHEELGFQWDGTHYCEEWVESYNNLEEVLEDWRLSILEDGMVFREGYGNLNKTLEEVLKDLRFIQKSDGTFTSIPEKYPDRESLLGSSMFKSWVVECRAVSINSSSTHTNIFCSSDLIYHPIYANFNYTIMEQMNIGHRLQHIGEHSLASHSIKHAMRLAKHANQNSHEISEIEEQLAYTYLEAGMYSKALELLIPVRARYRQSEQCADLDEMIERARKNIENSSQDSGYKL